ncbi:9912_t:CDS:2, partial [Diversispora eburnea]
SNKLNSASTTEYTDQEIDKVLETYVNKKKHSAFKSIRKFEKEKNEKFLEFLELLKERNEKFLQLLKEKNEKCLELLKENKGISGDNAGRHKTCVGLKETEEPDEIVNFYKQLFEQIHSTYNIGDQVEWYHKRFTPVQNNIAEYMCKGLKVNYIIYDNEIKNIKNIDIEKLLFKKDELK